MPTDATPIFFDSPDAFRTWLDAHHAEADEVVAGLWKAHTGKPTMTWPQSIDIALCFGWIDGVRHPLDDDSYSIRFTPRRAGSKWSQVNIDKVAALTKAGLMTPAGLAAFEARVEGGPRAYSPKMDVAFAEGQEAAFRAEPEAWAFWEKQPPSYRHKLTWHVSSAKSEAARASRLGKLIDASASGKRLT